MAWHSSTNNTLATYTLNLYQLITVKLAAGWTKIKDSDGTTYSSSGTQVTSGVAGVNGLNNPSAFVVMQSPIGVGGPSICYQRGTANDAAWYVKYSPSAGFTGGLPTATVTPTATDQFVVCGAGPDSGPTFTTWFVGTEGSTRWSTRANDAAPYCFWANGWPIGGGTPIGGTWYDGVINGAASGADDADKHCFNVDSSSFGWTGSGATSSTYTCGNQPVLNTMRGVTGVLFPWTTPAGGLATDPTNGKDQVRPLEFSFVSGSQYYKGQTQNILWEMTGTSTNQRPLAFLLSLVTTSDYIVIGQLAVPWDGSVPLI